MIDGDKSCGLGIRGTAPSAVPLPCTVIVAEPALCKVRWRVVCNVWGISTMPPPFAHLATSSTMFSASAIPLYGAGKASPARVRSCSVVNRSFVIPVHLPRPDTVDADARGSVVLCRCHASDPSGQRGLRTRVVRISDLWSLFCQCAAACQSSIGVSGVAATEITQLKSEDGGPMDIGGATLAASSIRAV